MINVNENTRTVSRMERLTLLMGFKNADLSLFI
jgi:hypothetical protein